MPNLLLEVVIDEYSEDGSHEGIHDLALKIKKICCNVREKIISIEPFRFQFSTLASQICRCDFSR